MITAYWLFEATGRGSLLLVNQYQPRFDWINDAIVADTVFTTSVALSDLVSGDWSWLLVDP